VAKTQNAADIGLCLRVGLIAGKQLGQAATEDTFLVAAACPSLTGVA
jgi:hypothetical protein